MSRKPIITFAERTRTPTACRVPLTCFERFAFTVKESQHPATTGSTDTDASAPLSPESLPSPRSLRFRRILLHDVVLSLQLNLLGTDVRDLLILVVGFVERTDGDFSVRGDIGSEPFSALTL